MDWQNKIVGHGEEPPDQLLANPGNWRIHPKAQQDALAGAIAEVGYIRSVTVNKRTGHVVDGHLRVALAMRQGVKSIPVEYVDLSEEEEAEALATLDPLGAMAAADKEKLDELLREVKSSDAAVQAMLTEAAERAGLYLDSPKMDDPGAQVDKAEELRVKWQTETGQLWELGEHRLICGDCTDRAVVERAMAGEKAQLVVTSPPYAVGKEYEVDTSFFEHLALLRAMADRCIDVIVPGGFIFTNFDEIAAQSHAGPLTGSKRQCIYLISKDYWQIFHEERGCDLYAQRIWYKPFNRLRQPFWSYHTSIPHHQEWEHIWTWRAPGGDMDVSHDWDISVHAVWDTRDEATDDKPLTRHVAAFPVGIPERAIRAHSDTGDVVFEPFSGSGTTLIACERLGRKCRAVEIEPRYVAVTLERWVQMTGKAPRLIK